MPTDSQLALFLSVVEHRLFDIPPFAVNARLHADLAWSLRRPRWQGPPRPARLGDCSRPLLRALGRLRKGAPRRVTLARQVDRSSGQKSEKNRGFSGFAQRLSLQAVTLPGRKTEKILTRKRTTGPW